MQTFEITDLDREEVIRLARSTVLPHRTVTQARALLRLADGASARGVAAEFGTWPKTVRRWRDRFLEEGPAGIGVIRQGSGP